MYGPGSTARSCLMAVRLVEKGVRMVQVYYAAGDPWDAHGDLYGQHRKPAFDSDRPFAAVIKDLKSRGLFNDTIVVCGSEFGRTPVAEVGAGAMGQGTGRDHNPFGFSMWLAGGGIKGGTVHGATDDFGFKAIEKPVHVHDLHATILHLLGIDHTKLTYRYSGRDFRLTDVAGNVVKEILGVAMGQERSPRRRLHREGRAFRETDSHSLPQGRPCRLPGGDGNAEVERAALRLQGSARRHGGIQGALPGRLLEAVPADLRAERQARRVRWRASRRSPTCPTERTLVKMAKEAAALNDAGVKVKRAVEAAEAARRKRLPYMLAALKADQKALAAWQAFSPSAQREYVEWVTEAKSERDARSPPRDRGRLDRRRQEAQLEVRTIDP